ncbi:MAG: 23S rRNA (guanosine(2251)-2'-O)-methyltransferase RlmB [Methylococcales bacterium]|jgi:23S rRNA (guanosine2251-2'-O)-methyltransferase|nr:23S rRNA (guanosine(2251)-2'-O)-methyltransferase RlmB [Methylococcales bacterium]MBT7408658.1 23S rRNA (guanosine(2251)-2'-O)-methyltransferase RlmB [Methylococcales bacterium]
MQGSDQTIIYGIHSVDFALRYNSKHVIEIYVEKGAQNKKLSALLDRAKECNVTVKHLQKNEYYNLLSDDVNHQGILAKITPRSVQTENELFDFIEKNEQQPFFLIIDGVQDPRNFGACLRTAESAGVQCVIIPKDKSVGITSVVRKVSCGASETINVFQVTNLARIIKQLKELGIWVIGLADHSDNMIYETDLKSPLALVVGAEGSGLRKLTREKCDAIAGIPMFGVVESLNVSVAAGIALFEVVRQRSS